MKRMIFARVHWDDGLYSELIGMDTELKYDEKQLISKLSQLLARSPSRPRGEIEKVEITFVCELND
jgi:hypothetical protein